MLNVQNTYLEKIDSKKENLPVTDVIHVCIQ